MSKKTDEIKEEIAQTKAELTGKLGELEGQLREDAASVKGGLEGTFKTLQGTAKLFSLKHQARQRPLLMLGGSVVSGLVLTRWVRGSGEARSSYGPPAVSGPSVLERVATKFPEEVGFLKAVAFNFLVSFVAEKAKAGMPHLIEKIGEIETQLKTKLDSNKTPPKPETT